MATSQVAIKPVAAVEPEEEKGIRVDPSYFTKLSNRHLNAPDWSGCSALAVLLYWWLCDKVTDAHDEDGVSIGVVMFGNPVAFDTIANDKNLRSTWRAVQRNMKHLEDRGFIRRRRHLTTQGYSYEVVGCAREALPEGTTRWKGKSYKKTSPEEREKLMELAELNTAERTKLQGEYQKWDDNRYAGEPDVSFEAWYLHRRITFNVDGNDDELV